MTENNDEFVESDAMKPEDESSDSKVETDAGKSVEKLIAERDQYLALAQRTRAEFENYQTRIRRDMEIERRYAASPVIADLLPILDNLDRALESAKGQSDAAKIIEGLEIVRRQFLDVFARHKILPIKPDGEPFDPNQHEAVMQQPSADVPPMTVLHTVETGYKFHDRVLRPAKVIVANSADA